MTFVIGQLSIPTPTPGTDIHTRIKFDRTVYASDHMKVHYYRRYSQGEQGQKLSDGQKEILAGLLDHEFTDNICHQIIGEASDRLTFQGWRCQNNTVGDWLANFQITQSLDDVAGEVHYDGLRDGNTVVALGWDKEKKSVQIYQEDWWDPISNDGVFIAYDAARNVEYGVKDWYDNYARTIIRRNVWFDNHYERYVSSDAGMSWEPYAGDGFPSTLPWVRKDKEPLHVPYVHFPNSGRGSRKYGRSELSGGVLGFADQVDDIHWSLTGAGRMTAFKIYWATGVEDGSIFKTGPGQMWHTESELAKFGAIEAGSVTELIALYKMKKQSVAQMTRTPFHVISGGEWPSGEALFRAELPAIGKAERQIKKFKSCWATVAHRAVEIYNTFSGSSPLPEDPDDAAIVSIFAPPERRDLLTRATVVQQLGTYISPEERLRILGYDDKSAEKILGEMRAEEQRQSDLKAKEMAAAPTIPGKGPAPKDKKATQ